MYQKFRDFCIMELYPRKGILGISLLFLIICEVHCSKILYTAVTHRILTPGKTTVHLTLHSASKFPINFNLAIRRNTTVFTEENAYFTSAGSKTVYLRTADLTDNRYNLTLSVTDGRNKIVHSDWDNVYMEESTPLIVIQTEKQKYMPGEVVKFRVFALTRRLFPFKSDKQITLEIRDGSGYLVESHHVITIFSAKGFHSGHFQLASEPNTGKWTISTKAMGSVATFFVEKFIHQKYELRMTTDPGNVGTHDPKVLITLEAVYRNGIPADVNCTLSTYERNQLNVLFRNRSSINGKISFVYQFGDNIRTPKQTYHIFYASCVDKIYRATRNKTTDLLRQTYGISYLSDWSTTFDAGQPFSIDIVFLRKPNALRLKQEQKPVNITTEFYCSKGNSLRPKLAESHSRLLNIPNSGKIRASFIAPSNHSGCYDKVRFFWTHQEQNYSADYPAKLLEAKQFMHLELLSNRDEVYEGATLKVKVSLHQRVDVINAVVTCASEIHKQESISVKSIQRKNAVLHETYIEVALPNIICSARTADIIQFCVPPDGRLIAQKISVPIRQQNRGQLSVLISPSNPKPGENVTFTIKGGNGPMYFGLTAVDKHHTNSKETIDIFRVKQESINIKVLRSSFGRGSKNLEHFTLQGVVLLSNTNPRSTFVYRRQRHRRGTDERETVMVEPREDFHSSWLFEDFASDNDNGELQIVRKVPSSMKSWSISAFQLGANLPLARVQTTLEVFSPMFLSFEMPPSIVMGEEFELNIFIHNCLNQIITSNVTVQIIDNSLKKITKNHKRSVVEANSASTVTFTVMGQKPGNIEVVVTAVSERDRDILKKKLLILPPGIKHTISKGLLLDTRKTLAEENRVTFTLPEKRVVLGDSLTLSVSGNLLGKVFDNLDQLVELPTGCDEQKLAKFVPSIVALDYLNAVGVKNKTLTEMAMGYLEIGYQQQLARLKPDGSYTYFDSNETSSTWLTAYVTRAFVQAQRYIEIDPKVIEESLEFLKNKQNPNGSFAEQGLVYDGSLLSGKNGEVALTADVLLTLIEARRTGGSDKNLNKTINSALQFIDTQNVSNMMRNPYALAVVTYAFQYAGETKKASKYFKLLNKLHVEEKKLDSIYWKTGRRQSIEATSYALLTYLLRGDVANSFKIGRWLMNQRNRHGGFESSHDTVVGIQSLGKLAKKVGATKPDMKIVVTHGNSKATEFHVNSTNWMKSQKFVLPVGSIKDMSNNKTFSFKTSGKGIASVLLNWNYYIEATTSNAFSLNVSIRSSGSENELAITSCARYTGNQSSSNMVILTVSPPTGHEFEEDVVLKLLAEDKFSRYEFDGKDLVVYYTGIKRGMGVCLPLKAVAVETVQNAKPAKIIIMDYYDNTQMAEVLYTKDGQKSSPVNEVGDGMSR